MRVAPLTEGLDPEGVKYEERRKRNVIALLGVLQRREIVPSRVEWSIIQKGLDDTVYRTPDVCALLFMAAIFPSRKKLAAGIMPKAMVPILAGLYGYEFGLQNTSYFPASDAWRALVMMDSKVGEVARVIYAPKDPDIVPECQYEGRRSLLASYVDFLFLRYTFRSIFESSSVWDRRSDVTDMLNISITTRFFKWRPLHFYKRTTESEGTTSAFQ